MSGYNYGDRGYPDRRYEAPRGGRGGYRGGRDHYRGSGYRGRGRGAPRGREYRRDYGDPRDPRDREPRHRDPRDRDPRERDPRDRDPRDRDPRDSYPRDSYPRDRDPRELDPRDRDPRDRDPRERDPRDRDPREYREEDRRDDYRDREPSYSRDRPLPRDSRDGHYSDHRGDRREFTKETSRSKSVGTPKHDTSSPRHIPSSGTSPRASRDQGNSGPTYTDPWISILHIRDGKVALRLEARHQELANVNKSLGLLQAQVHKLKAHMDLLDVYAKRDALNVEMTSEKLDEFTFL